MPPRPDTSHPPPGTAQGCAEPGCTGIHSSSHGRGYASLCPAAKRAARARQRASRARLREASPAYREAEKGRLNSLKQAAKVSLTLLSPEQRCAYPGCPRPRRDGADLCAKTHARRWSPNGAGAEAGLLENDGLVDWQAISIAAGDERRVQLTWIERDIAIAMILAAGHSYYEAARRTSFPVSGEHDSRLRGARFRRLARLGKEHFGNPALRTGAA